MTDSQWGVIMVWARILLCAGVAVFFVPLPAHAEVRIGAAGPLTGTMAWFGEQHERGVAMAVAEINQAGGLLGELAQPPNNVNLLSQSMH